MNASGTAQSIVGMDTIGLSYRVADHVHLRRTSMDPVGSVAVKCGWAYVEASLPRLTRQDNVRSLPLEEVESGIAELLEMADRLVGRMQPGHRVENVRVKRVDLVRDFHGVPAIPSLLSDLSRIAQPGTVLAMPYIRSGYMQTLSVGAKTSWMATLYDKHKQSHGVADPGHLRFEARFRSRLTSAWALNHGGKVNVVPDLHPKKLDRLARSTWDEVQFGRPVAYDSAVAILADSNLSGSQKISAMGWLAFQSSGHEVPISDATERKYRRQLAEVVVASDGNYSALDWETGSLLHKTANFGADQDLLEEVV
ncbi:MAG: hypothetical protein ACSLFI_05945 [Solirubrobacterales bacterium]